MVYTSPDGNIHRIEHVLDERHAATVELAKTDRDNVLERSVRHGKRSAARGNIDSGT